MSALRTVLFTSLVAIGLAVALFAVPTTATDVEPAQVATVALQTDEANNTSQMTVGAQISGFMQEQTSQTDGAVESGMWSSAYENAGDGSGKAALVNQRTEGLAAEVASLQSERRELIEARQAGNITALEFRSRMHGLTGRYTSVLAALDETEPRAEEVGANVSTIEELRSVATEAAGPAVAAAAGNASVSPPGLSNNTTVGPPIDVPGQGNETEVGSELPGNGSPDDVSGGNSSVGVGDDNDDESDDGSDEGNGIDIGEGDDSVNGGGPGNGQDNGKGSGGGSGNWPALEGPLAKVF